MNSPKRSPHIVKIFYWSLLAVLWTPLYSKSQKCEKLKLTDFPAKDLPTAADRSTLKGANPWTYYYGIGVQIDYVKARAAAFLSVEKPAEGELLDGYAVLLMCYANGFGVDRNLDLSIRLACGNVWGSDLEVQGRMEHLKAMQSGDSTGIFDICDDITSGAMDGFCHSIRSALSDVDRKRAMDSVISRWTKPEKQAFQELRKAAENYFNQREVFEVDLTGTSRDAFMLDESDELEDHFLELIKKADHCALKKYSPEEFLKADRQLNRAYAQIKDNKISMEGSVTREGVKETQKKWIAYRDAWVDFGAVKCPGVSDASWKTMLTKERTRHLQDLVNNQY